MTPDLNIIRRPYEIVANQLFAAAEIEFNVTKDLVCSKNRMMPLPALRNSIIKLVDEYGTACTREILAGIVNRDHAMASRVLTFHNQWMDHDRVYRRAYNTLKAYYLSIPVSEDTIVLMKRKRQLLLQVNILQEELTIIDQTLEILAS